MRRRYIYKSISSIIVALIVTAIVASVLIAVFSDSNPTTPNDDATINDDIDIYMTLRDKQCNDVVYLWAQNNFIVSGIDNFSVSIKPNPNEQLDYSIDGKIYRFSSINNFDEAMNLTITASGFSITIPGFENAIENTIAAAIGTDKQVILVDDFDDVPEPWILTISNGSLTKEFVCRIGCNGQNLTLDQSQIIFG